MVCGRFLKVEEGEAEGIGRLRGGERLCIFDYLMFLLSRC
jgi:hypothetical protein